MGWVQAGFMLISPACAVAVVSAGADTGTVVTVWAAALLVVAALALVDGARKLRAGRTAALGVAVFAVKLASIPFFIANFVIVGVFSWSTAFMGIGVILAALAVPVTWAVMLTTSIHGWFAVAALRRDGLIVRWVAALYAVLLAVFITDIVVGVMIFVHSRRVAGRPAIIVPATG